MTIMKLRSPLCYVAIICANALHAEPPQPTIQPARRAVDLQIGESAEVMLADGNKATVRLVDLEEKRDTMSSAVREARVKVEINGTGAWLTSAIYNLPQT